MRVVCGLSINVRCGWFVGYRFVVECCWLLVVCRSLMCDVCFAFVCLLFVG